MIKQKKHLAILMVFCMVFVGSFGGSTSLAYGQTGPAQTPVEAVTYDTEYVKDPETGYIYPTEEQDVPTSETALGNKESKNQAVLPSLYPAGGVTEIVNKYPATRTQSPYGTCWAHAGVACAEFDLIKNHGYSSSTDLSELQGAYFTYHTANDKMGHLNGDQNYIPSWSNESFLDLGGNGGFLSQTFAQWKGLTYENSLPYSGAANALSSGISTSFAKKSDGAKLENVYIIDIKNNPSAVKAAIQTYGAVQASYYHDSQYYDDASGYSLYFCPDSSLGTNHDIAIVGWNDNLPAYYFPSWNRPARNGGWLIRNSWSTKTGSSEYSYFWMSYDDKSLAKNVYAYDFVPATKYANIYQYDGSSGYSGLIVEKAASVFIAKNPDYAGSEVLNAIQVAFMSTADVDYQIDIYTSVNNELRTNPEGGYHHAYATTTGTTTHAGVHTIYLRQPVYLMPGELYSIVVTSKEGRVLFTTELTRNYTYTENGVQKAWFNSVGHADAGESLYKGAATNASWTDAATDSHVDNGNFRIKGLTTNSSAKKYIISYNLNGGVNHDSNPVSFLSTQSGGATLQSPVRSGYHFLGWYSDSALTQRVTSVNYGIKADQTFYAKWCSDSGPTQTTVLSSATASADGSYQVTCSGCGRINGVYPIYRLGTMSLNDTKPAYTGNNVDPYPVVYDAAGKQLVYGTDYTYAYNKAARKKVGRYAVTITFHGKYNGSETLNYTVVPKKPSSASAKLYGYNDIKVTWSKCTGASGYYVYYKKSTAAKYTKYKRTTKRTLKFSNLSGNTKYNFKIVPFYKKGDTRYLSSQSKVISATTLKKLTQPSMQRISGGKVSLKWQNISGATGYQVYWSAKKGGKYKKLCQYSSKYTGVTFSVGKGETYWYKTRAYKQVGNRKIFAPWSAPKKFIR